jgi:hypothetical protein
MTRYPVLMLRGGTRTEDKFGEETNLEIRELRG